MLRPNPVNAARGIGQKPAAGATAGPHLSPTSVDTPAVITEDRIRTDIWKVGSDAGPPLYYGYYRHRPGTKGYDAERVQVLRMRLKWAKRERYWLARIDETERDLAAVKARQDIRSRLGEDDRRAWDSLDIHTQNRVAKDPLWALFDSRRLLQDRRARVRLTRA